MKQVTTESSAGYRKHVNCIKKNEWTKDRPIEDLINNVISSLEGYNSEGDDNDEHCISANENISA